MSRPGTVVGLAAASASVVAVVTAPLALVLGANRLVGFALLAVGAWLLVARLGLVDLATAASAGAGAYAGGVLAGLTGLPALAGLVTGALAGAVVSALGAAVGGRVGRAGGALSSLAIAGAVVALLGAWSAAGGPSGYHAVPLLTPNDRADLAVGLVLLAAAVLVARRAGATVTAAAAAVAAEAPEVATGLGRRPAADTARAGAVAGAILGAGGALQAALVGSVAPGGYGLGLAAALALAALLAGRSPVGAVVAALALWGPAVVWPLVPLVGDAPVLLTTGVVGVGVLAARRAPARRDRAPATAPDATRHGTGPAPDATRHGTGPAPDATRHGTGPAAVTGPAVTGPAAATGPAPTGPVVPSRRAALEVPPTALPGGEVAVTVSPGEVVVLVGPNGSGKSTLLARVAGQLPDGGTTRLGGRPLPPGPVRRARAGLARSWQRPPEVAAGDAEAAVVGRDPARRAAAAWAREVLGPLADTPPGAQLVRVAAARPAVALLDEPAAALPVERVAALVRGLAAGGAAVLVVEHPFEAVALADRVLHLGPRP